MGVPRNIPIDVEGLAALCARWRIKALWLFGSALRADFRADSDIDLLVSFEPGAQWSLLDHVAMQEELSALLCRDVDLITRRSVERSSNWIRRHEILSTAEPLFVP